MTTQTAGRPAGRQDLMYVLFGTLLLGSIWGVSEVALGGALQAGEFPYRAGLLTGIGMGTMGVALALFRKPAPLLGMGIVAVAVKLLVVPMLQVSVLCKANSCLAVGIQASSLGLLAFLAMKPMVRSWPALMGGGALAALGASAAFYFIGMRVAPCAYLQSFSPGGFVVTEGLVWAAFSAILLPLGYQAGARFALHRETSPAGRMPLYYAASAAGIAASWVVSAGAILVGA